MNAAEVRPQQVITLTQTLVGGLVLAAACSDDKPGRRVENPLSAPAKSMLTLETLPAAPMALGGGNLQVQSK